MHQAAVPETSGASDKLPHAHEIQNNTGGYDISNVQAHTSGPAAEANRAMGADAWTPYAAPVQRRAPDGDTPEGTTSVHQAAAHGISGGGGKLPDADKIQKSFGGHDISNIQAHTSVPAAEASRAMGADAYATGNHVVLGEGGQGLHTQAHEAAHVVQQRAGVALSGGVGQAGDAYEQNADAVADAVVEGKSAEGLLGQMTGGAGGNAGVQMRQDPDADKSGGQTSSVGANVASDLVNTRPQESGNTPADAGVDRMDTEPFALDSFNLERTTITAVTEKTANSARNLIEVHFNTAATALKHFTTMVLSPNASPGQDLWAALAAGLVTVLCGQVGGFPLGAALLVPSLRTALANYASAKVRKIASQDSQQYIETELCRISTILQHAHNGLGLYAERMLQNYLAEFNKREIPGLNKLTPKVESGSAGRYLKWLEAEATRNNQKAASVKVAPYEMALFASWVQRHEASKPGGHWTAGQDQSFNGYIRLEFLADIQYGGRNAEDITAFRNTKLSSARVVAPGGPALVNFLKVNHDSVDVWALPVEKRVFVSDYRRSNLEELDFSVAPSGEVHRIVKSQGGWETRGPWRSIQVPLVSVEGGAGADDANEVVLEGEKPHG